MTFLQWTLILGGLGLAAGTLGPIQLNPQNNMRPLIGVFVTGPLGVVTGVAGYLLSRGLEISPTMQWRAFAVAAVLLVGGTLLAALPGPELEGYIIDSVVERCRPAQAVQDEVLKHWDEQIAGVKSQDPRRGWREDMIEKLLADGGVVVDARVVRRTEIRAHRKPWNRGQRFSIDAIGAEENQSYYDAAGGNGCAAYPVGTKLETFVSWGPSFYQRPVREWPPVNVERFILRSKLREIPAEFQKFRRTD
ncbi:MAG: hypothetical protein ABJC26_00265 [Gemmatimonadaceae bacterium]